MTVCGRGYRLGIPASGIVVDGWNAMQTLMAKIDV